MTSWMREEPTGPSSEDYLLGKAIDKNFEQEGTMGQINAVEYDCTPASIFASQAEHQVDVQRKLQEDPLVALKKQEFETRKKVLDNPIRMKQIQKYIEKIKKKKKKKEKKKRKRKSRSGDSSSDSDSEPSGEDLDKLLLQKLDQLKDGGEDVEEQDDKRSKDVRQQRSRSGSRERHKSRRHETTKVKRRSRSHSRDRRMRRRSRSRSQDRRKQHHNRGQSRSRERHGGNIGRRDPSPRKSREPPRKESKSEEDKEREKQERLREMMENAKWREDQRSKNVKHYRELDKKEEEMLERPKDPDFIRKQLAAAATSGTVEKRIQSNRYNIQRKAGTMDSNFAKR